MPLTRLHYLAAAALALCGYWLLRHWQGPEVPVHRLSEHPLVQTVVASGRVAPASRAQIGSELTGVVLERHVQEGDVVAAGDLLLVLRADDLLAQVRQAEAELEQLLKVRRPQAELALARAEAELTQARRETARRRDLAGRGLLADEALEQAAQAEELARLAAEDARLGAAALAAEGSEENLLRARLASLRAQEAKTRIRAEAAGTVLTRDVEPGDLVQPGRVLFTLALQGDTEILLPVDEKNLSQLALGQEARVAADAWPQHPFMARIRYIAPRIDPERGTVELRLLVPQPPDFLRQDMTVSVNIETARRERALALPNDALLDVQGDAAEVLLLREGRVTRVPVRLGLRGVAASELLAGAAVGDLVLAEPGGVAEGDRARPVELPWPLPPAADPAAP